jgi:ABC-type amino acid transport substrate-binding protein
MPPETPSPGSPTDWLRHAHSDVARLAILAVFAALLLLPAACSKHSEGTLDRIRRTRAINVGTDATYPPFDSVDPATGAVVGYDMDIVRALARTLGAEARFQVVPFDGIIAGLKTGKYEMVASAMTITPERAQQVTFTRPYALAGQAVAVRAGETRIAGAADLAGLSIGCQLGTTGEMEAKKIPRAKVVSFDAIGAAFRDLENRNLDAVIADIPTASIFAHDHPTIRLAGEPITREEFGFAVRLTDADLPRPSTMPFRRCALRVRCRKSRMRGA